MIKERFFSIVFYLVLFIEPIFYSVLSLYERGSESGDFTYLYASSFFLTLIAVFLFMDNIGVKNVNKMYVWLLVFGALYYCTSISWGSKNSLYMSHFFKWGASSIPATMLGMSFNKQRTYEYLQKYIPLFTIPLTFAIANVTLKGSIDLGQYKDESGLNYQQMAYYYAFMFGLSVYYIFISNQLKTKHSVIIKLLLFISMIFQVVFCLMSGGRGGMGLLFVEMIFLSYFLLNNNIIKKSYFLCIIFVSIMISIYVANKFDLWNSAGFARSFLSSENHTLIRQENIDALRYFDGLGHGLGSIFYTYKIYSHNFIVDLLVETGILGTLLFIVLFIKTGLKLFFLTKIDNSYMIILLIFIYAIVENTFSLYWISTSFWWFGFGCAYTYSKKLLK